MWIYKRLHSAYGPRKWWPAETDFEVVVGAILTQQAPWTNVEKAMGDGIKRPVDSEDEVKKIARRSLVSARDIKAGSVITRSDISIKRPGNGIPPELIDRIVNKKTRVDIRKDSLLKYSDLIGPVKR